MILRFIRLIKLAPDMVESCFSDISDQSVRPSILVMPEWCLGKKAIQEVARCVS